MKQLKLSPLQNQSYSNLATSGFFRNIAFLSTRYTALPVLRMAEDKLALGTDSLMETTGRALLFPLKVQARVFRIPSL
jgi:hypothetical protein